MYGCECALRCVECDMCVYILFVCVRETTFNLFFSCLVYTYFIPMYIHTHANSPCIAVSLYYMSLKCVKIIFESSIRIWYIKPGNTPTTNYAWYCFICDDCVGLAIYLWWWCDANNVGDGGFAADSIVLDRPIRCGECEMWLEAVLINVHVVVNYILEKLQLHVFICCFCYLNVLFVDM